MQVTIELSEQQVQFLKQAFQPSRFSDEQELANTLAPLAISSWLDWLMGSQRYNSLTEQYTDWVEKIFQSLLNEDEAPTPERLFNSFNIPYGQAQYIARVLNNRWLSQWRLKGREQLAARMLERSAEVAQWMLKKHTTSIVELVLSRLSYREMELILEDLYRKDPSSVDIPHKSEIHALVSVQLTARTFTQIASVLGVAGGN